MAASADTAAVLRLTTAPHDLARVHPWLDAAAAGLALPESMLFGMHVALEEAVANVAMHGFDQSEVGQAVIHLYVEGGGAVLLLEDDGRPFDVAFAQPAALPARLEDAAPGGLGLRLLRHYCAAIGYQRCSGRNRLTLRFTAPGRGSSEHYGCRGTTGP